MVCIESLVGLSATVPKCFSGSAPEGYNVSESGYFVNDSDYGMRVIEGCEIDGWTLLEAARDSAIRHFKTDLRSALYNTYQTAFRPFSGLIGQTTHSGPDTSFSKPYCGLMLEVDGNRRGMSIAIKGLYLGLNDSDTYTVTVFSTDPDFETQTYTLTSTANVYHKNVLEDELLLPLYSPHFCDIDQPLKYYIQIDLQGAKPLNGKLNCCGAKPGWMSMAEVSGFGASGPDLQLLETNSQNRGLVLECYLKCDDLDWICNLSEMAGYQTKDVVARAIQYRAGVAAYGLLIDRNVLNICTMYNMEAINAHRNFLTQKYAEYIAWITENVPMGATSCLKCKDSNVFNKASQLL